ncbi:MAG: glycosyltransferase family 39 protein [Kiritimatiellae bacterium]|nr:glycosyltransferase family 39 protein [Kiritimatiellia bacterium]
MTGLLILASVLRLIYAWDLPLNPDEQKILHIARQCSLRPSTFHVPLGSHITLHPLMTAYLTAVGLWLGGGSVLAVRVLFTALSIVGLYGLFRLAETLSGLRAAVLALGLAAIDRYLVAHAPVFTEPAGLFLVPWLILTGYRALTEKRGGQWLLLGAMFGAAYLFYEIFLLLLLPLGAYAMLQGKLRGLLRNRAVYLCGAVMTALILPSLVWDLRNQATNVGYIGRVASNIGLTPRFFLLLFGDLLVNLKTATWILLAKGNDMYLPMSIPCHWLAGLIYLGAWTYSLRWVRDSKRQLLILCALAVGLIVSVVHRSVPWNNFWWANATLVPMIILAGGLIDRLLARMAVRAAVTGLTLILTGALGFFLAGPKFVYTGPTWEKRYLGTMSYLLTARTPAEPARARARTLTQKMLEKHPDAVIVQHFRAILARSAAERVAAIRAAQQIEPHNPAVGLQEVKMLAAQGKLQEAREVLRSLIDNNEETFVLYGELANIELRLDNYAAAESNALAALRLKPNAPVVHIALFCAQEKQGKRTEALATLHTYAAGQVDKPYQAYVKTAQTFAETGEPDRAAFYYNLARDMEPALPAQPAWLRRER